jgi:hypothetical protein
MSLAGELLHRLVDLALQVVEEIIHIHLCYSERRTCAHCLRARLAGFSACTRMAHAARRRICAFFAYPEWGRGLQECKAWIPQSGVARILLKQPYNQKQEREVRIVNPSGPSVHLRGSVV